MPRRQRSRSVSSIPRHDSVRDTNSAYRQFYKLSKAHHPDLHPNDPTASQHFVKISEAHATLASPEKRAIYDRDFLRATQPRSGGGGGGGGPSGSYSSASTPAGGRPASGLSRRRTQFRGPPPSFYRSGGWGQYSEKREEHASKASHAHEAQGDNTESGGERPAGTGPNGFATGFDNDVPHFDQRGHYQTHSGIEKTRHKARRKRTVREEDLETGTGNSVLFNFAMLSGVLGIIYGVTLSVFGAGSNKKKVKEDGGG